MGFWREIRDGVNDVFSAFLHRYGHLVSESLPCAARFIDTGSNDSSVI